MLGSILGRINLGCGRDNQGELSSKDYSSWGLELKGQSMADSEKGNTYQEGFLVAHWAQNLKAKQQQQQEKLNLEAIFKQGPLRKPWFGESLL